MRRWIFCFVTILFAAALIVGQDAKPQPTPTPATDNDVVKITTNLIQLDVTVTDSKGRVVTDLKPEEIEIFENGEKQKITNFSFITSVREKVEKPKEKDPLTVPEPPKVLREQQVRRTIALVVDDLSMSFESVYYTRRALKKFVDEQMRDGDLVAIIRTGAGIGALQQFTADKRMLYAAIEKVKWNPMGGGGVSAFAQLEAKVDTGLPTPTPEVGERTLEGIERENRDFRSSVFASGTLGAINYVVLGMADLPGRKSIILMSDGFTLFSQGATGFRESSRIMDSLRRLIEMANRASVVINTIDPRGLQYTGLTAADNTNGYSLEDVNQAISDRSDQLRDTQDGLNYLAQQTGGIAIRNNNDLSGGVQRIIDDLSYYLIAYEPDSDTFDPAKRRFNKLAVKVLRPGLKVRYRSGFFNVVDRETPENTTIAGKTPIAQIQNALVSPFAVNGINLRLNALFGRDDKNGMYVRSVLHVDTADMKFTDEPNGDKKVVFDVLAVSVGDNGRIVEQLGKSYTLGLPPAAYKQMTESGFVYHFMFPVKKPGAYQYRVALRDTQGGRIGSASQFIDVPDLKKKRLTLSSVIIENLSEKEWDLLNSDQVGRSSSDPMKDTALRRVKLGSILRYGFEVYNAKLDAAKLAKLNMRIRVFRDGQMVLDGKQNVLDLKGQTDMAHIRSSGAVVIGGLMQPGDYVLQIIVTDELAEKKKQIATQFIQFEVVN